MLTPETPEGMFGIRLLRGGKRCASMEYAAASKRVAFQRVNDKAEALHKEYPSRQTAALAPEDGTVRLRLFVDSCSAELFCCGGAPVFTEQLFPAAFRTVPELFGQGAFHIRELTLWSLEERETPEARV